MSYILTVSYKGYDYDKGRAIGKFLGNKRNVGAGYCFLSRKQDVDFSFKTKKLLRKAEKKLVHFKLFNIRIGV